MAANPKWTFSKSEFEAAPRISDIADFRRIAPILFAEK
jgi:hypothetical protein